MPTEAPAKDTDRYFEEIGEDEEYTVEAIRTITETDVVNFAGISGDFHPYHMSSEFMEDTEFGERIAHGVLVFAIAEALVADMNPKSFTYGHEGLRFPTPTYIGDTLTVHREVVEKSDYDEDHGRVDYKYVAENQEGDPLFVCKRHITLVEKRK
jgi:acyl dehydratase